MSLKSPVLLAPYSMEYSTRPRPARHGNHVA
jgi:hypothetical protein